MPLAPGQVTELRGLQDKDSQTAFKAASHLQQVTSLGNALYAQREAMPVHRPEPGSGLAAP
jgi:hypothetical protein